MIGSDTLCPEAPVPEIASIPWSPSNEARKRCPAGKTPEGLAYREANSEIRQRVLAGAQPALTVVITGIYDERWFLEIEAVAYQHV